MAHTESDSESQVNLAAFREVLQALALGLALVVLSCNLAHAWDASNLRVPEVVTPMAAPPGTVEPSISSSIPTIGDFKNALLARGVNLQLSYIQDTFGNATGGVQQGVTYSGALYMLIDADLATLAGLYGMTFRVSAYQLEGQGLSLSNVYNYSTISSIEALPTTRLFELWIEQKLFDSTVSIRVGQLLVDNQFFVSEFAGLYVNGTFGWPTLFAANLPGSGPGYPLTTPGARFKLSANDQITLLGGIFNGDPAGTGFTGLEQVKNPAGISFRVNDPPLLFGEVQFSYNQHNTSSGLAGTVKLGAWYHFGTFDDNHFGFDGRSLADPLSAGMPLAHSGDYTAYAVIDQVLWRLPGDDAKKGVAAFARVAGSPANRNLMDFYSEAGVNFIGVLAQRPDDSFGCAAAFSRLSPPVRAFDQDAIFFSGELSSVRDYELALELTYQAQIVPGWTVQPDFQYIIHPGGGAADPYNPAVRIPNAAVFGVRTVVTF